MEAASSTDGNPGVTSIATPRVDEATTDVTTETGAVDVNTGTTAAASAPTSGVQATQGASSTASTSYASFEQLTGLGAKAQQIMEQRAKVMGKTEVVAIAKRAKEQLKKARKSG